MHKKKNSGGLVPEKTLVVKDLLPGDRLVHKNGRKEEIVKRSGTAKGMGLDDIFFTVNVSDGIGITEQIILAQTPEGYLILKDYTKYLPKGKDLTVIIEAKGGN